jgi:integrase
MVRRRRPPRHCVFHRLRKAALTRLADAGCTVHELAAISGHKTLSEVQRYTNAADQARLAKAAMERMGNQGVKPEPGQVSKPLSGQRKKLG